MSRDTTVLRELRSANPHPVCRRPGCPTPADPNLHDGDQGLCPMCAARQRRLRQQLADPPRPVDTLGRRRHRTIRLPGDGRWTA